MAERFAGQESKLALVNSTTQDPILPDIAVVSMTGTLKNELVKRNFLGETGPDHREFADGYELEIEVEITDAAQIVTFINAMQAKAKGKSNDQFSASTKYVSPDGGSFRLVFPDLRWDSTPMNMGGRTDFLKTTLKASGKTWKAQLLS